MKFQKFPIFHLWVCVTDSPRWDGNQRLCRHLLHEVPGVGAEGGGRALEALHALDGVVHGHQQLEHRRL